MEHDSHFDTARSRRVLEAQIRECFGRVVYSHKTHEKRADMLLDRLSRWKFIQIALSVIITGTLIINLFGDNWFTKCVSALLSAVLLFLNTYFKNYDLGQLAQKHKDAADKLWNVRESYLSLLADLEAVEFVPETIIKRRDELQKSLSAIYSAAPRTTAPAYARAQTALQKQEDLTFSDEEIDAFLPRELKRAKSLPEPQK